MQIEWRDRNDAPWCTTSLWCTQDSWYSVTWKWCKGKWWWFCFPDWDTWLSGEKKKILVITWVFDHVYRGPFPWRHSHKSVFVVHHLKPLGIIDFQQECLSSLHAHSGYFVSTVRSSLCLTHRSYKHFMFHGETLKMAVPSCPHR